MFYGYGNSNILFGKKIKVVYIVLFMLVYKSKKKNIYE